MQLDFTAALQPALWGLLVALLTSATALALSADRNEIDLLWRYEHLRNVWRVRVRRLRSWRDRLLARARAALAQRIGVRVSRE